VHASHAVLPILNIKIPPHFYLKISPFQGWCKNSKFRSNAVIPCSTSLFASLSPIPNDLRSLQPTSAGRTSGNCLGTIIAENLSVFPDKCRLSLSLCFSTLPPLSILSHSFGFKGLSLHKTVAIRFMKLILAVPRPVKISTRSSEKN
jgi:hypothetical protein